MTMRTFRRGVCAFLESVCLGVMVVSLTVDPMLAAELSRRKAPEPPFATEKAWGTPLIGEEKVLQLLNRATFGSRPGDVERVRRMGIQAFLDEQLHPEKIEDSAVEARVVALPTFSMNTAELLETYPQPMQAQLLAQRAPAGSPERGRPGQQRSAQAPPEGQALPGGQAQRPNVLDMQGPRRIIMELAQQEVLRAVYSNRQLQEVMVQFWMNHFNIFAGKGADRWLMTSFERDTIRPQVLGKFEDLLVATAQSPAMLFYLDNWMSATPNPTSTGEFRGRSTQPVWNSRHQAQRAWAPFGGRGFGRRGLFGRAPLGRWPIENQRAQIPGAQFPPRHPANPARPQNRRGLNENYARELMELHTLGVDGGYTQRDVLEVARCFTGWTIDRPRQGGGFVFNPRMHDFGEKVVLDRKIPGGRGQEEGLEVLHLLATHPSTAHFISLKLSRRFVADEPPSALVDRASQVFLKTQGDLREVLRTILTSQEFYSQAAYRAKMKSPLELVASSLRALGGETDAGVPLLMAIGRMGQPMFQYQAPTGFPDKASTWISSSTLLTRVRFALMLTSNRIPGTQVDLKEVRAPTDDASRDAILDDLAKRLVGGRLAPETREAVLKKAVATDATLAVDARDTKSGWLLAGLVLASPDFQRR